MVPKCLLKTGSTVLHKPSLIILCIHDMFLYFIVLLRSTNLYIESMQLIHTLLLEECLLVGTMQSRLLILLVGRHYTLLLTSGYIYISLSAHVLLGMHIL